MTRTWADPGAPGSPEQESRERGRDGGGASGGHVTRSGAAAEPGRAALPLLRSLWSRARRAPPPTPSRARPEQPPASSPPPSSSPPPAAQPRSVRWGPPPTGTPTWGPHSPAACRAPCCCCCSFCCSPRPGGPRRPRPQSSPSCAGGWPAGAPAPLLGFGARGRGRVGGQGALAEGLGLRPPVVHARAAPPPRESCLRGGPGETAGFCARQGEGVALACEALCPATCGCH